MSDLEHVVTPLRIVSAVSTLSRHSLQNQVDGLLIFVYTDRSILHKEIAVSLVSIVILVFAILFFLFIGKIVRTHTRILWCLEILHIDLLEYEKRIEAFTTERSNRTLNELRILIRDHYNTQDRLLRRRLCMYLENTNRKSFTEFEELLSNERCLWKVATRTKATLLLPYLFIFDEGGELELSKEKRVIDEFTALVPVGNIEGISLDLMREFWQLEKAYRYLCDFFAQVYV